MITARHCPKGMPLARDRPEIIGTGEAIPKATVIARTMLPVTASTNVGLCVGAKQPPRMKHCLGDCFVPPACSTGTRNDGLNGGLLLPIAIGIAMTMLPVTASTNVGLCVGAKQSPRMKHYFGDCFARSSSQ